MSKHYVMVLFVVDPTDYAVDDTAGGAQSFITNMLRESDSTPHFDVKYSGTVEPHMASEPGVPAGEPVAKSSKSETQS